MSELYYLNRVLLLLYEKHTRKFKPEHLLNLYEGLETSAHAERLLEKLFDSRLLNRYDKIESGAPYFAYSISTDGIGFVNEVPDEFKETPFTYFLDLQDKETERQKAKDDFAEKKSIIDYKIAERIYKNYPITKFAAWVGAISGVIALLLKALELLGILHPKQ